MKNFLYILWIYIICVLAIMIPAHFVSALIELKWSWVWQWSEFFRTLAALNLFVVIPSGMLIAWGFNND